MRKFICFIIMMVSASIFLSACGAGDSIEFSDVWARPGWRDGNSAVFFVVDNPTDVSDQILSASSDVADAVEIHKSSMVDDVMRMEKQDFISLPAGEEVLFKSGGLHIMLIGLKDDLIVADKFTVTLTLEKTGEMTLDVVVKEP